jgi:hypothetical protein
MAHRILRLMAMPFLIALLLAPLGMPPAPFAAQAAPAPQQTPLTPLALYTELEPNNTPADANARRPIGNAAGSWLQPISGVIAGGADIDYYRFEAPAPGSLVRISLSGLSADYDLVLAAAREPEATQRGLENVAEVGGTINAIGGTINAIGGTINAIGGTINAIGGTINAIGGTINAISANAGAADEQIETILWAPGAYYVAVAPANGDSTSAPYRLNVELRASGLAAPEPAPEVEVRIDINQIDWSVSDPAQITTLYITNSRRMEQRFPAQATKVVSITSALNLMATLNPPSPSFSTPEYGLVFDIGQLQPIGNRTDSIDALYADWDANAANPFYANRVAELIDNLIEAVTVADSTPGASGPAPAFRLGAGSAPLLSLPNIRYIVLVGGDETIPFFRAPDLTTIANEADYAAYLRELDPSGIIDANSALGGALRSRMLLTDNPYGAERPYRFLSSPIYLPRLAVGRLVETPVEIVSYLARYNYENSITEGNGYTIDYSPYAGGSASAFVSGYDFLIDQATTISGTLERAGFAPQQIGPMQTITPGVVNPLINNAWTAPVLEQRWFSGLLATSFPVTGTLFPFTTYATLSGQLLSSVNAHFDHWQIIPAQDSAGTFPALRLLAPTYATDPFATPGGYFAGTLHYSVGCHSGYNVPAAALSLSPQSPRYATYAADFPQAFIRHAGNWIGNTGYGYGTLDGVDYSEQLAVLLTEELLRNVRDADNVYIGQAIGTALMNAKQRYLRNLAIISAYDAKALAVMTLYGLPYVHLRAFADYALPAPPEIGDGSTPPPAERPVPEPIPIDNARLERIITVTIDFDNARTTLPRTGSTIFNLTESDFTVEDSFVEAGFGDAAVAPALRILNNNQPGVPMLPSFAYDISARNASGNERLVPRDVQFLGGIYGQENGFNPQMTRIITETSAILTETDLEPTFEAGAGIWYPARFFGLSSVEAEGGIRDQLTSAAAQFRADADGRLGAIRPYSQMIFRVLYIDPGAEGAAELLDDNDPPVIERVVVEPLGGAQIAQGAGPTTRATVIASDARGSGLQEVRAIYILNDTQWIPISFSRPDPQNNPQLWVANIPLNSGVVRLIVSATDRAGNTSYYTAKGSFNPPEQPRLYMPTIRR